MAANCLNCQCWSFVHGHRKISLGARGISCTGALFVNKHTHAVTCLCHRMIPYAHHHMNHKSADQGERWRRTDQRFATARHRLILQEHEVPSVWVIWVSRHMRYICFCHLLSASLCPPRHFLYFIYCFTLFLCFVIIWDMAVLKLTV